MNSSNTDKNSSVTAGEFYNLINKNLKKKNLPPYLPKNPPFGEEVLLNKKNCAYMVHSFLLDYLQEQDEDNWSSALKLKDVYDCRVCVIHIAQCYVKGIIFSSGKRTGVFGNDETVIFEEVDEIIKRMLDKSLRKPVLEEGEVVIKTMTEEEARRLGQMRFVDVRDEHEIALVSGKVEYIDFQNIYLNPLILGNDFYQNIMLCCDQGYLSRAAAELLKKNGYKNLFVLKR